MPSPARTPAHASTPYPALTPTSPDSPGEEKGVFIRKMYESESGGSIPYQFLIPESLSEGQSYPLVVFLHGAGELGTDNRSQLAGFPWSLLNLQNKRGHPAFVIAPQCPLDDSWTSFPDYPSNAQSSPSPTRATRLTIELVETLLVEYSIDARRVYVIGFSLGGEGAFDIVSRRPDLFAAAVPICGIADVEKAPSAKDVPMWIFHGEKDDINPVEYSRMMYQALKDAGGAPRYTEYEGAGHDIWSRAYDETGLFSWLFLQRKRQ
jgi:predicted peptidase